MSHHPLRKTFKPDVPQVIASQANDVEKYLLDQCSVMHQQNSALIETTLAVEAQTTKTNGRVAQHDLDIASAFKRISVTEDFIRELKKTKLWIVGVISGAITLIGPVLYFILEHFVARWLGRAAPVIVGCAIVLSTVGCSSTRMGKVSAAGPKARAAMVSTREAIAGTRESVREVRKATAVVKTSAAAVGSKIDAAQLEADKAARAIARSKAEMEEGKWKMEDEPATPGAMERARAILAARQGMTEAEEGVKALQAQLVSAKEDIKVLKEAADWADQRAEEADARAAKSDLRAEEAQKANEQLIQDDARKAGVIADLDAKVTKLTAEAHHQTWLAWKWRLIALGCVVAFGLYLARGLILPALTSFF